MAVAVQAPATESTARLIGYDSWDEYFHDLAQEDERWRDEEAQRGIKAMRLATCVAVYHALLQGQPVPYEALDPKWRSRYRL